MNNKDGRIYDRFRNRVMFPIIDVRGEVIGFGGRVMDDSTPKYLNSPDTPVYNKSRNVFALNIAKSTKAGRVILTEGYMDTISLHQAGFDNAVASLGTSLTAEHAQLLSRYFQEVVISYDGDGAGVAAAQRAIPLLEKAGLKVRVLQVTGAKDPDEFIKTYGRDAFARLLDQSENQVDYRLDQLKQKYNLEDDAQRVAFLQEAAQLLATLSSAGGAGDLRRPRRPDGGGVRRRRWPRRSRRPSPAPAAQAAEAAGAPGPDPCRPAPAPAAGAAV